MILADTITLYKETPRGVFDTVGTDSRTVYADIAEVGMNEYYQAMSAGLAPEIVFELADWSEYDGEKRLVYNDVPYKVIRAAKRGMKMRLVCEKEAFNG